MPTSRDLNSGDSLFFTTPPPPTGNSVNPTPDKYGNDLGHYMNILSKLMIIVLMPEMNFVSD